MFSQKTIIILAGPTAVGKTGFAIQLAERFQTEIISADSRQCYRELNIGVARPSEAELARIPHHFIASHSIHEPIHAAGFADYALEKAQQLFQQYPVLIMTGGTGMYIRAFADGLDQMPPIEAGLRESIRQQYAQEGLAWLQQTVQAEDPEFFASSDTANPQRLMRALEVMRSTGRSIRQFQSGARIQRPFRMVFAALECPRPILHQHIDTRIDQMLNAGLEAEARSLQPYAALNALQTVGYREWWPYFEGKKTYAETVAEIRRNTRLYAKRQMTWFKRDQRYTWFGAGEGEDRIREFSQFWNANRRQ